MKGPILTAAALILTMGCLATDASAGGSVSANPEPTIECAQGGHHSVTFSGTWDWDTDGDDEVRGVCEPDYWFGSVPVVYADDDGSPAAVTVDEKFDGTNWELVGAYVWFEYGYWAWSDLFQKEVWYCRESTNWCYIDSIASSCFAAGTPVLLPTGSKPIEQIRTGDLVLTLSEKDPDNRATAGKVIEVIRSRARLVDVSVGGQVVHASREHPFYVRDKGWTSARSLAVGDSLRSADARWFPVESVVDGGEAAVYNLRVEPHSAFFVGSDDWGFSLWVYGACKPRNNPMDQLTGSSRPAVLHGASR